MDNENAVIYGLEFQARALAPQLAETEKIRYIIGTQSLKQTNNQIHLLEFDEEKSTVTTLVFHHTNGEIWKISTSPLDASKLSTCYNSVTSDISCTMKSDILKIPETENPDTTENLDVVNTLDTSSFGNDVKTTEFHPTEENKSVTVTDSHVVLWDISESAGKSILNITLEGKNNPKFTTGKWNPYQNCNQFTTATESHLKTYDIRTGDLAWSIEGVHSQLVRDLDYNMNKQYYVATCGDDGFLKIWDFRQTTQPVFARSDHSHWVWSVRFNHFHDQLILTASSDARVLLSSAASVSSENNVESCLPDDSKVIETKQM
nr:unnamed protein product [Callosobruchus chinensis]